MVPQSSFPCCAICCSLKLDNEQSLLFSKVRRASQKRFHLALRMEFKEWVRLLFMRFTSTVLRGVLTSIFFPWLFLTRAMDFTEKQGLLVVQSDMLDVLKTGMFQLLVAAIFICNATKCPKHYWIRLASTWIIFLTVTILSLLTSE